MTIRAHSLAWTPVFLLAVSLIFNVTLVARLRPGSTAPKRPSPVLGSSVPEIVAYRLGGAKETVRLVGTDRPTLLYVLRPDCHWTLQNMPNFNALSDASGREFSVVGLSLSALGLAEFVQGYHVSVPIYYGADPRVIERLGVSGTPETLLISTRGTVLRSWRGAYSPKVQKEIGSQLQLQFPGLATLQ